MRNDFAVLAKPVRHRGETGLQSDRLTRDPDGGACAAAKPQDDGRGTATELELHGWALAGFVLSSFLGNHPQPTAAGVDPAGPSPPARHRAVEVVQPRQPMGGNLHGLHGWAVRMRHVRQSPCSAVLAILHEEIDVPAGRIVRGSGVFKQRKSRHGTAESNEATRVRPVRRESILADARIDAKGQ